MSRACELLGLGVLAPCRHSSSLGEDTTQRSVRSLARGAQELAMPAKRLRVVIIGGGIGGLFAANALVVRGFQVSVYEQAPNLGEIGAGVFLTPNSVRQLQRVGLGKAVEKFGARVGAGSQ